MSINCFTKVFMLDQLLTITAILEIATKQIMKRFFICKMEDRRHFEFYLKTSNVNAETIRDPQVTFDRLSNANDT